MIGEIGARVAPTVERAAARLGPDPVLAARAFQHTPAPGLAKEAMSGSLLLPHRPGELRIVNINVHQWIPDGFPLPGSILEGYPLGDHMAQPETILDLGRFIRDADADVVFLQEIRNNRIVSGERGLTNQWQGLLDASGATDGVFGSSVMGVHGDGFGVGVLTRNGWEVEDSVNVLMPQVTGPEPHRLLIADIRSPAGEQARVGTMHLDHTSSPGFAEHGSGGDAVLQVRESARIVRDLATTGEARVFDPSIYRDRVLTGWKPVIFGGDLNALRERLDGPMLEGGMRNVLTSRAASPAAALAEGIDPGLVAANTHRVGRIDHIYTSGDVEVARTWVTKPERHALTLGTEVTDHDSIITDVILPPR